MEAGILLSGLGTDSERAREALETILDIAGRHAVEYYKESEQYYADLRKETQESLQQGADIRASERSGRLCLHVCDTDGNEQGVLDLETLLAEDLARFEGESWELAHHARALVALRRMTRAAENRLHELWGSKDWFENEHDRESAYLVQEALTGEG